MGNSNAGAIFFFLGILVMIVTLSVAAIVYSNHQKNK